MKKLSLNNFQLKMIAIFFMTLSHIQFHLDINNLLFIGQLSFPIFAYLSAEAYVKTSNKINYIKRLLIYGAILQIPLLILGIDYINIFITLGLGVVCIHLINKEKYLWILPIYILTFFVELDYGSYGILLIITAYLLRDNFIQFAALFLVLQFSYIVAFPQFSVYQWYATLALPFIYLYNGELGTKKFKYFFYIYYPLHVIIIYAISLTL